MARTYMCYTCNGDFERGYWIDTGDPEEIFYCDRCAAEAGITDSEHARRQLPYDGWTIRTGFHAAEFPGQSDDADQIDIERSGAKYADMIREKIEAAYPGATVEIEYDTNATGALPASMQTSIVDPESGEYRPGDGGEGGRIAEHVDELCGQVWESWEWVVYAPRTIESDGDYHSVKLLITPDSVEVSGGIDQDAAFNAAVEETGGDRNSIEANTRYSNIVADALTDIANAVVAAGITGGEPEYKEHDSYCEAKLQLRDGRTIVLCAHYYDGNFDAYLGEE